MSLKEYIQNLINYDNKVNEVNTSLKNLKKGKTTLEQFIINILTKNNYVNSKFEIDNKIVYMKKKETPGTLSLELIREVLSQEIKNPDSVELLMDKIVEKKK
tara:strand:- start:270 stop:575 length:306 start_codon:yes stop_codon:yes gene_type:complete